jgi:hypothetical protein
VGSSHDGDLPTTRRTPFLWPSGTADVLKVMLERFVNLLRGSVRCAVKWAPHPAAQHLSPSRTEPVVAGNELRGSTVAPLWGGPAFRATLVKMPLPFTLRPRCRRQQVAAAAATLRGPRRQSSAILGSLIEEVPHDAGRFCRATELRAGLCAIGGLQMWKSLCQATSWPAVSLFRAQHGRQIRRPCRVTTRNT